MTNKTIIGIDPSMNSTGICINDGGVYKYILLSTKPTKKMLRAVDELKNLRIIPIQKEPNERGVQGAINQTKNISYIIDKISTLLTIYRPHHVTLEAPAFNATGRIADLSGLNHAIRLECLKRDIPFFPLTPTSVKMQTTGNGAATKEMMIETWLQLFPEYKCLQGMKIDDLADAWAMCEFPVRDQ